MNESSPYQSPLSQTPTLIPPGILGEPPAVKAIGIMHLVFAGYGILGGLSGLFFTIFGNPILKILPHTPQVTAQLHKQEQMQQTMAPINITMGILSCLVAIPMIIAGIRILKQRRDGLPWSNIYAVSSLGAKMINLILSITIMIPAMTVMAPSMPHAPTMIKTIFTSFATIGALGAILITCAYPVITLVILNRPACKQWFASRPK
jgi:hypothetical protein